VLLAVADRLRRLVRGTDAVYRIGGDEFVVVADGMPATICAGLAKRIAASVGEPIALDDTSVRVQCSVGTAVLLPGAGDGGSALDEADRAMYAVKTSDTSVVRSS
jgi:diguanylate cyclase (GGDEF)-like protein